MTLRMRKGDLVQVVSGSDKGKQGRITEVRSSAQKVRVEGVRMQTVSYTHLTLPTKA